MAYRRTGHPSSHLQRHTPLFALSLNVMLMCMHTAAQYCVPFKQCITHTNFTHTCTKVDKRKSTSPIIRGAEITDISNAVYIQGVTGGTDQTSGECSLGQTILI